MRVLNSNVWPDKGKGVVLDDSLVLVRVFSCDHDDVPVVFCQRYRAILGGAVSLLVRALMRLDHLPLRQTYAIPREEGLGRHLSRGEDGQRLVKFTCSPIKTYVMYHERPPIAVVRNVWQTSVQRVPVEKDDVPCLDLCGDPSSVLVAVGLESEGLAGRIKPLVGVRLHRIKLSWLVTPGVDEEAPVVDRGVVKRDPRSDEASVSCWDEDLVLVPCLSCGRCGGGGGGGGEDTVRSTERRGQRFASTRRKRDR